MNNRLLPLLALASFSVLYGLAMLWYVPTQPALGFQALLVSQTKAPGVEIVQINRIEDPSDQIEIRWPQIGDRVLQVGPVRIRSFHDLATARQVLRDIRVDAGGQVAFNQDPGRDSTIANRYIVEYPDHTRLVRVWYLGAGAKVPIDTWLPLQPQPSFGIQLSFVWFVLQSLVVGVGVLACWYRPFDEPARAFLIVASLALIAFIGGNHWWVIGASLPLVIPFVVAGIFLPAALAHFCLIYPVPKTAFVKHPRLHLLAVYGPAVVGSLVMSTLVIISRMLSGAWGNGPFAAALEAAISPWAASTLPLLRSGIHIYLTYALTTLVMSVIWLMQGRSQARNPLEQKQVDIIFLAALFGVVPVVYCTWLSLAYPASLSYGGGRIPVFLASLGFMLAYGIGIVRYKLMLVDQMLSRNVWYYLISGLIALAFSSLLAVGSMQLMRLNLTLFGRAIPLLYVLTLSILIVVWGRDAIQRSLDRRFFREKYRLDRALQRMNSVVSSVLDPEVVAASLLNSCADVLRCDQGLLYTRRGQGQQFKLLAALGRSQAPLQIQAEEEVFAQLTTDGFLQRVPSGRGPSQTFLRSLGAHAIYGMELDGKLIGLVALGAKPAGAAYTAEDVAFVTALGRMTAIALHCARINREVGRLNEDLQLKMEKISEQARQIELLQQELAYTPRPVAANIESGGADTFDRGEIQGSSPAIERVLDTVRKVAASDASILVRGESGTGKELLAQTLHRNSNRRNGPLVTVHCAALSPTLLESELFGHVKGAFTDAREDKVGRFALAHGGTLFLDEIGDISLEVQVKLLRVLQERAFEPVGSSRTQTVDVRLITATHRNLEELIQLGRFREDLFYRLNVISIKLPALRERAEDLPELAFHFLREAAERTRKPVRRFDESALELLRAHSWPGNIRELKNVIERAVVLSEGESIRAHDLPPELRSRQAVISSPPVRLNLIPAQVALRKTAEEADFDELTLLREALNKCQGNKAEAARSLGMPRSTFFSKLKKHGLG